MKNGFTINKHPEISYQLMDCVMKKSFNNFTKNFFILKMYSMQCGKT